MPLEVPVRRGFTLVELLVVLVLMGLLVGIVAPALRPPDPPDEAELAPLVRVGRAAALRRGEPMVLTIERDGRWEVRGGPGPAEQAVASGRVATLPARALRVHFSPLGTCAPDAAAAASDVRSLDLLDCAVRAP